MRQDGRPHKHEHGQLAIDWSASVSSSHQERPKAREHELLLEDPPHLLEHKLLDLAHVLETLLPIPLPANLALNLDLLQQATHVSSLLAWSRFGWRGRRVRVEGVGGQCLGVLGREKAEMHSLADVGENGDPVERQACDVELQGDADE